MTDEDVDENDEYEAGKEEHNHKETQRKRKEAHKLVLKRPCLWRREKERRGEEKGR